MVADHGQERGRQDGTEQGFQVVGQTGQRQRPRVFAFLRKNIRDQRLERGREGRGSGLEHKNENVDLPGLGDERERDRDPGPENI